MNKKKVEKVVISEMKQEVATPYNARLYKVVTKENIKLYKPNSLSRRKRTISA